MRSLSASHLVHEQQTPPSNHGDVAAMKRIRFRYTLKQLSIAIAVIAVLLAAWVAYFRKVVTVRAATTADPVRKNYFGLEFHDAEVRNVVVVSGGFTRSTWLSACLYAVQSGGITQISGFTIGRSPNRSGPIKQTLTIYLALGTWDSPYGRVTQLGIAGHSRGTGGDSAVAVSIPNTYRDSFVGSMTPGRRYLIYIEGDSQVQLNPNLTIEEFAKKHSGNYLVVAAQLH